MCQCIALKSFQPQIWHYSISTFVHQKGLSVWIYKNKNCKDPLNTTWNYRKLYDLIKANFLYLSYYVWISSGGTHKVWGQGYVINYTTTLLQESHCLTFQPLIIYILYLCVCPKSFNSRQNFNITTCIKCDVVQAGNDTRHWPRRNRPAAVSQGWSLTGHSVIQ